MGPRGSYAESAVTSDKTRVYTGFVSWEMRYIWFLGLMMIL